MKAAACEATCRREPLGTARGAQQDAARSRQSRPKEEAVSSKAIVCAPDAAADRMQSQQCPMQSIHTDAAGRVGLGVRSVTARQWLIGSGEGGGVVGGESR